MKVRINGVTLDVESPEGLEIDLSPEDLAELWCAMDAGTQAKFFSSIAVISEGWSKHGGGLTMQLHWVAEDVSLTEGGRGVMQAIGRAVE